MNKFVLAMAISTLYIGNATANADINTDAEILFNTSDAPMQLAQLSPQEMQETEGAFANFAIGAGIGFSAYVLPLAYNSAADAFKGNGSFVNNFTSNFNPTQAAASTAIGAATSGLSALALRGAGVTINYSATSFSKAYSPFAIGAAQNTLGKLPMVIQQGISNNIRTYTSVYGTPNLTGIAIKGTSFGTSFFGNRHFK